MRISDWSSDGCSSDLLFRSNPNTGLYGASVVNALDKTIAPGMGMNKDNIVIGIIHEDGPYGTDVGATEKARAGELGYKVAEVLPYSAKTVDLSSLRSEERLVGKEGV